MILSDARSHNNIKVTGSGEKTLVMAHGFGCDQTMWRYLIPHLRDTFKIVTFDYVGSGQSDPKAFSLHKYAHLQGYAQDIVDVCETLDISDAVLVGHSVSAMTGLIAAIQAPHLISKMVMICPSPYFMNDPPLYQGGFEQADLEDLIGLMDKNYIAWANHLAPVVIGLGDDALAAELSDSFCSTDPVFAKTFAKATFFSDCRDLLPKARQPTLLLQSSDDSLAPVGVGRFLESALPNATMQIVTAHGHCLHMTHAAEIAPLIRRFIAA